MTSSLASTNDLWSVAEAVFGLDGGPRQKTSTSGAMGNRRQGRLIDMPHGYRNAEFAPVNVAEGIAEGQERPPWISSAPSVERRREIS